MNVQQAYSEWASTYDSDRNLTRDLDQTVTRGALKDLRPMSMLEIGCGTGKNTALYASIATKVLALDFSAEMIQQAKNKSVFDNVTFTLTDINESWPCPDRAMDLVTCNLVLEHIEHLSFIFAEAARVLNHGGLFFISELHPFRQYQGVQAHFRRNDMVTQIPAFIHHISDFLDAAAAANFSLIKLQECWHAEDEGKPPRLISLMFAKTQMVPD